MMTTTIPASLATVTASSSLCKLLFAALLVTSPYSSMTAAALTSATSVAEFAAKPFVRAALKNPSKPGSVLSFFLGVDYNDNPGNALREGQYIQEMQHLWFAGGAEYDELCQPFCSVIRAAGAKQLLPTEFWQTCVDGQVSQLILCDQLSRNCFRGTDEAYSFDDCSLDIARNLANQMVLNAGGRETTLKGEFYPPYSCFVAKSLMHSESLKDHETCLKVLDWASENAPHLKEWWQGQKQFELEHKKVIDEFGRYPYRNEKKGRKSTEKELEWLANEDELPLWAKSQL